MREIKFRAWNEDYKCMDDFFFVQSNGAIHESANKTYDTPNTEIEENPNLIIMQYTGLKDKNGVEIYEGDILGYGENVPAREVIFENGAFRLSDSTNHADQIIVIDTAKRLLVTGNMHQNPELLD